MRLNPSRCSELARTGSRWKARRPAPKGKACLVLPISVSDALFFHKIGQCEREARRAPGVNKRAPSGAPIRNNSESRRRAANNSGASGKRRCAAQSLRLLRTRSDGLAMESSEANSQGQGLPRSSDFSIRRSLFFHKIGNREREAKRAPGVNRRAPSGAPIRNNSKSHRRAANNAGASRKRRCAAAIPLVAENPLRRAGAGKRGSRLRRSRFAS